jgi:hypothetical protein
VGFYVAIRACSDEIDALTDVIAGLVRLVPAISIRRALHVNDWMAETSPAMTIP